MVLKNKFGVWPRFVQGRLNAPLVRISKVEPACALDLFWRHLGGFLSSGLSLFLSLEGNHM